jgi:hypothetical protein
MFTLNELSEQIAAYRDDRLLFAEFENWFEDNSAGVYDVPGLREACIAVDAALSRYHFDHVGEVVLKSELANASRPFVLPSAEVWVLVEPAVIEWIGPNAPEEYRVLARAANSNNSAIQVQSLGSNATWRPSLAGV